MRLALVISSLTPGGAEKVMAMLANYWASQNNDVTLFTLSNEAGTVAEPLSDKILCRPLGLLRPARTRWHGVASNLRRAHVLRRVLKHTNPDVVVSFIERTNVLVLLATIGLHFPVVVSERVDPKEYRIPFYWRILRILLYRRAASLVVQSPNILSSLNAWLRPRARVIPNPVLRPAWQSGGVGRKWKQDSSRQQIVALGRLTRQKGFDLLIRAFADVAERFPDWDLVIWGEGEKRVELETLRDQLDLNDRVALPGWTTQPAEKLVGAELFVLASRFEGFPNALCEAMACGLPVIATDCPSGPSDIVRHEVDGLLVRNEDSDALARAMERLMADRRLRKELGRRAEEIVKRFSMEKVMEIWEETLKESRSGLTS